MRFERKMVIDHLDKRNVEMQILCHPAHFSEIYEERQVNNIYFDTVGKRFYNDNVIGIANRKKIRLRWYGHSKDDLVTPTLEVKCKFGILGNKLQFKLPHVNANEILNIHTWKSLFLNENLPLELKEELKSLQPTLCNTYVRKYFLSQDKKFRLTLDSNLSFADRVNRLPKFLFDQSIVLEIKYAQDDDANIKHITNHFNFRISKNSKYVNGIEYLQAHSHHAFRQTGSHFI